MLNLQSRFEHFNDPYELHIAQDLLSRNQVRALYDTMPRNLNRFLRDDAAHEKQYALNLLFLAQDNVTDEISALSPEWQELLLDLQGDVFADWIEAGVGKRLRQLPTDIGIYTYDDGDYISVHKDKPHKAITAVLYLNEVWPPGAGGDYEMRTSGDPDEAPVRVIPPRPGQLLAFPPTSSSWHAVSRVNTQGKWTRLTVQLEYWNERKPR